MKQQHTDRDYQAHLNLIRDRFLSMTDKIATMIESSIEGYITTDQGLVDKTSFIEREINNLEIEIDNLCISALAKRQPVASDLRFIVTVLKITPNIERIGDHTITIGKRTGERAGLPEQQVPEEIRLMEKILITMLRDTQRAFTEWDEELAKKIIEADARVDAYYSEVFRKTLNMIESNPGNTFAAMNIQGVIKNIERMGDHIKSVSELIYYMSSGKDIRHSDTYGKFRKNIKGVLFLCLHNSARSQMAEAIAKNSFPEGIAVYSAGSDPAPEINPRAVKAMAEIGIDISMQRPKRISEVPLNEIDVIITLCSEEICVDLPVQKSETWNLPDIAHTEGDEEKIQGRINSLRDEIRFRVETTRKELFK